jgi:ABC-type antimicrobial peptide transport system permease subunit
VQAQQSAFNMRGIIESRLPQAELQRQLQAKIDSGELELGQLTLRPLGDIRDQLLAPDLARSLLTIGTASLVVLLAAFGFYGTQRYLVTAGRREYAIRASLGAGPTALGRLVFRRGLMLSLPGLATGALLAFIVVAWLRDGFISDDVGPGMVVLGVVVGLSCLLVIASLGPARQARRTQPAPLLRED